ncbi:MAG: replicative DNA helicase [Deltaproteobacteria bacterium]|jgi:replicative DNA helicase|nr:replicative DNA helicase [Deltaproteobacteria bacterium]
MTSAPEDRAAGDLLRRVPPHSVEAEQAVLAGIFLNPEIMSSIADMLRKEDFYIPAHQIIYNAFLELDRKRRRPDIVTVAEYLRDNSQLEQAGGAVFLSELNMSVVSGASAAHYAPIVRDKGLQRQLIAAASSIIGDGYDASLMVDDLLEEASRRIFAVSQRITNTAFVSSKDLAKDVFNSLRQIAAGGDELTGISTGFSRLDQLTAGLQPSDLIIVGARPSMGKTSFALNLAMNAAIYDKVPVCFFSLEMSSRQLMMRMLAARARVDATRLRRPHMLTEEDWACIIQASDDLSHAPIFIDDSASLSPLELRARTRRYKAEHNIGLVIVDYLQLMYAKRRSDSRELEISDISRSLKALAKEMNIPVVALSQLNRKLEERPVKDRRPMLSDLRESGAIEQDADVVLFIYREDVYKYPKVEERPLVGDAEIIIGKQRNGPVGRVELTYHSVYASFVERDFRTQPSEYQ